MQAPDLVHRFLTSIGRPEEADTYLELFRSDEPERFAVVVVGGEISIEALGVDLHFLAELGLTPVVAFPSEARRGEVLARLGDQPALRPSDGAEAAAVARGGQLPGVVARDVGELAALVGRLGSRKVVFLTPRSGLQPGGESVRSLIDLTTDLEPLLAALPPEQAALLRDIDHLLGAAPHPLTAAVTSPFDLLRELFTIKGAGSLVRRGARVTRHASYRAIDRPQLDTLLRSAFGRAPIGDFFDRIVDSIYLAEGYRGAAIVESRPLCPYLSKFAVDVRARGEGVGGDLWRALCKDYRRLLWRSRPSNPIARWYEQQCDGLVRQRDWHVYWRGLRTDEITWAVELALDAPVDFAPSDA